MAGITYFTARQSFLNEREAAVQRQAFANASLVPTPSASPGTQVNQLLESVDTVPGSRSVLYIGGQWYATSISVGQSAIPRPRRDWCCRARPPPRPSCSAAPPRWWSGVPLPASSAAYFEVFSLDELAGTLRILALTWPAAALVTTVAGAAVGRWASGRALRPLAGVTEAAVAMAGGQLDTRVEAGGDADLAELAASFNRMADNLQARIEREARFTSDVSHELRRRSPPSRPRSGCSRATATSCPRGPSGRSTCSTPTSAASRAWSTTSSRSRGSTPGRPSCPSTRSIRASWCAGRSGLRPVGRRTDAGARSFPVEVDPGVRACVCGWTSAASSGSWPTSSRTPRCTPGAPPGCWSTRSTARSRGRWPAPHRLLVVVEDRGPGIPAAERDRIFERFYRGGRAGQRASGDGTGLGLSLVAEHVRLHGGSVWVEDTPGGARFVVELPVDPGSRAAPRRPGEDRAERRRTGAGRPASWWLLVLALWPGAACGIPTDAAPKPIAQQRAPPPPRPGRPPRGSTRPPAVGVTASIFLVGTDQHVIAGHPGPGAAGQPHPDPRGPAGGPHGGRVGRRAPDLPERRPVGRHGRHVGGVATVDFATNPARWWGPTRSWPSPRWCSRPPNSRGSPAWCSRSPGSRSRYPRVGAQVPGPVTRADYVTVAPA